MPKSPASLPQSRPSEPAPKLAPQACGRQHIEDVHLSPIAARLVLRQRDLEAGSPLVPPSRSAWPWYSQLLGSKTLRWLGAAFPECPKDQALAQALREFSPGTSEHSRRVADLVYRFANDLGLEPLQQETLQRGAQFLEAGYLGLQLSLWSPEERRWAAELLRKGGRWHDIGKLSIPEHILHKEGPLTPQERQLIEMHPLVGEAILEQIGGFEDLLPTVRHHHERWDGQGYVDGLAGDRIPFSARLMALADCYDALSDERPYRQALSPQQACQEILRQRGGHFQADLAEQFVAWVLAS